MKKKLFIIGGIITCMFAAGCNSTNSKDEITSYESTSQNISSTDAVMLSTTKETSINEDEFIENQKEIFGNRGGFKKNGETISLSLPFLKEVGVENGVAMQDKAIELHFQSKNYITGYLTGDFEGVSEKDKNTINNLESWKDKETEILHIEPIVGEYIDNNYFCQKVGVIMRTKMNLDGSLDSNNNVKVVIFALDYRRNDGESVDKLSLEQITVAEENGKSYFHDIEDGYIYINI